MNATQAALREIHDRLLAEYGPQRWWPGDGPFETIVGAILTQNAAWTNVEKALASLKAAGAMSAEAMRTIPEAELAQLVRSSGYYNAKARKLKAMAVYLAGIDDDLSRLRSRDAKDLRAELLGIHGIGPETADDIVLYAAGLPSFVIDAYTVRIVDRLGLAPLRGTQSKLRAGYDAYQALFEANLPPDAALFNEFHALLDAHAVRTCRKRDPRCASCCLRSMCAYAERAGT